MAVDYSIIIPAYNETEWLPATLAALQRAMAPLPLRGEIIVVDNNSSDGTATLASEAGARVVFEPVNQISRARNAGAREAQGRYLIFVDADTQIPPPLLARALDNLQGGRCVGGGAKVSFDVPLTAAARAGLALWNGISARMKLAAGCFVYCRREAYAAAGGFSEAVYASEEIWISRALRRWGRRQGMAFCVIDEPTAHSSGRKMAWFSTWQQAGLLLLMLLFPFFVRFKRLCGFWYKRPEHNHP
jgi:glycosyltransferase involved in cell wall biosynthesis